jgi:type I restriction enzyme S subunit
MNSEWVIKCLGDCCDKIGSGATPKGGKDVYLDTGPVRLIRSQNIYNEGFVSAGLAFISDEQAKRLDSVSVQAGDVLLNITGDSVARVCQAPEEFIPARVNQHVAIIRPRPSSFDARFLRYFLASPIQQDLMFGLAAAGATRNALTKGMIESFQVPCPPLAIQSSIAETLGSLDDRITLLRETNATLEAIAQALFKSWFVDFDPVRAKMEGRVPEGMDEATAALFPDSFEETELGEVPRGWRVVRLGEITERITKGTTPTTLKRPFVDSGINFVKAESMTGDGGFIPEKFAFIDDETHELLRRSQLQHGDVLISIAGTIGRIAVMSDDFLPANTNQAVALIRPISRVFPSGLINRFFRLSETQQKMREKVVQAVQANLSLGILSDLMVVIPSESVVGKLYESGLAQIDASWVANDRQVRTLSILRDTLLPRLISGQLSLHDLSREVVL